METVGELHNGLGSKTASLLSQDSSCCHSGPEAVWTISSGQLSWHQKSALTEVLVKYSKALFSEMQKTESTVMSLLAGNAEVTVDLRGIYGLAKLVHHDEKQDDDFGAKMVKVKEARVNVEAVLPSRRPLEPTAVARGSNPHGLKLHDPPQRRTTASSYYSTSNSSSRNSTTATASTASAKDSRSSTADHRSSELSALVASLVSLRDVCAKLPGADSVACQLGKTTLGPQNSCPDNGFGQQWYQNAKTSISAGNDDDDDDHRRLELPEVPSEQHLSSSDRASLTANRSSIASYNFVQYSSSDAVAELSGNEDARAQSKCWNSLDSTDDQSLAPSHAYTTAEYAGLHAVGVHAAGAVEPQSTPLEDASVQSVTKSTRLSPLGRCAAPCSSDASGHQSRRLSTPTSLSGVQSEQCVRRGRAVRSCSVGTRSREGRKPRIVAQSQQDNYKVAMKEWMAQKGLTGEADAQLNLTAAVSCTTERVGQQQQREARESWERSSSSSSLSRESSPNDTQTTAPPSDHSPSGSGISEKGVLARCAKGRHKTVQFCPRINTLGKSSDGGEATAADDDQVGLTSERTALTVQRSNTLPANIDSVAAGGVLRLLHEHGLCKPCAFYYNKKKGCRHGDACEFCHHEDHSRLSLKQWKKQQKRMQRGVLSGESCHSLCDPASEKGGETDYEEVDLTGNSQSTVHPSYYNFVSNCRSSGSATAPATPTGREAVDTPTPTVGLPAASSGIYSANGIPAPSAKTQVPPAPDERPDNESVLPVLSHHTADRLSKLMEAILSRKQDCTTASGRGSLRADSSSEGSLTAYTTTGAVVSKKNRFAHVSCSPATSCSTSVPTPSFPYDVLWPQLPGAEARSAVLQSTQAIRASSVASDCPSSGGLCGGSPRLPTTGAFNNTHFTANSAANRGLHPTSSFGETGAPTTTPSFAGSPLNCGFPYAPQNPQQCGLLPCVASSTASLTNSPEDCLPSATSTSSSRISLSRTSSTAPSTPNASGHQASGRPSFPFRKLQSGATFPALVDPLPSQCYSSSANSAGLELMYTPSHGGASFSQWHLDHCAPRSMVHLPDFEERCYSLRTAVDRPDDPSDTAAAPLDNVLQNMGDSAAGLEGLCGSLGLELQAHLAALLQD